MKAIPRLLSKVFSEPWLITPEKHRAIRTALAAHLTGTGPAIELPSQSARDPDKESLPYSRVKQFAVISVNGIIGKRLDWFESMCGGYDLDTLGKALKSARDDSLASHIIIDWQTPGGTVTGVPETGDLIARINQQKPVTSFCETQACSAGTWLATQAGAFYATSSSCLGSIGCYMAFLDESASLEMEGLKMEAVQAGKYKLAGAWWKPLSEEERELFQSEVNTVHENFKGAVWRNHPNVPEDAMEGQTFDGDQAKTNNLIDEVVSGFDDLIERLS